MPRTLVPLLSAAAAAVLAVAGVAIARPFETFTLGPSDKIIAETPGCHASCVVAGGQRSCTVKTPDCRAICQELAECKPDGVRPMKVCAIVRETR